MQNNRITCHATKHIRYAVPVNAVDAIRSHYTPPTPFCSPTMSESEWDRPLLPLSALASASPPFLPASSTVPLLPLSYSYVLTSIVISLKVCASPTAPRHNLLIALSVAL